MDRVSRQAEPKILIGDRTDWGRGSGTRAIGLLLAHGFDIPNPTRFYLKGFERKERALHIYRKLGSVEKGRFRQARSCAGRCCDTVQAGIWKDEFTGARAEAD